MAQMRCSAPSCRSLGNVGNDHREILVINPELCEYREILLCKVCAAEARSYGVSTVELLEARKIIRQHELDIERAEFFLQFVPAQQEENQAMSA